MISDGTAPPSRKVGKRRLFRKSDVDDYLDGIATYDPRKEFLDLRDRVITALAVLTGHDPDCEECRAHFAATRPLRKRYTITPTRESQHPREP
jgi:hypothetical protein